MNKYKPTNWITRGNGKLPRKNSAYQI
jgi:hypothetical protein